MDNKLLRIYSLYFSRGTASQDPVSSILSPETERSTWLENVPVSSTRTPETDKPIGACLAVQLYQTKTNASIPRSNTHRQPQQLSDKGFIIRL